MTVVAIAPGSFCCKAGGRSSRLPFKVPMLRPAILLNPKKTISKLSGLRRRYRD
jgi:hypothetical protein